MNPSRDSSGHVELTARPRLPSLEGAEDMDSGPLSP